MTFHALLERVFDEGFYCRPISHFRRHKTFDAGKGMRGLGYES
jgi:hypothetical protein